jgi:hypothetical protein
MTTFSSLAWLACAILASLTLAVRCRDNPTPIPEVPPKPPAGSISER